MALTQAQSVSLYQILEIPMFAQANHLVDADSLNYEKYDASNSPRQVKAALDVFLADLAANYAALETELKTMLDRWTALGTQTTRIDAGSVGDIQGVTFDFDRERVLISERVKIIVPFYRRHEEIERIRQSNPIISVIR